MILKNWHEFETKLVVEVNDSFMASGYEKLDVIGITLDEKDLKVYFSLSGGRNVSEDVVLKNILTKEYQHKPHRNFLEKLFSKRGDMYQNQQEVEKFLINRLQTKHPEQYQHYLKSREEQ